MKSLVVIAMVFCASHGWSQTHLNLDTLQAHEAFENILVKKLHSDSLSTSFVIWVKNSVADHYHAKHTETLLVLDGEGEMRLGDETLTISKGDFITVPANTVHGVVVTSATPMKVLSTQSPEFLGEDRVFIPAIRREK